MNRIAKFEKVSFDQFCMDWKKTSPATLEDEIRRIYDRIQLPKRATAGSAGYDLYAPVEITLKPKEEILVPTGLRCRMVDGYVLMVFPRSGLGFKFRLQMNNTVGIIDADYYGAENQGHIFCKLTNDTHEDKTVHIDEGAGMVQGIFVPFGITEDDDVQTVRTGGFGSTTKKEN